MGWLRRLIDWFSTKTRPTAPVPPAPGTASLVDQMNLARASHGLPLLSDDAKLSALAISWAAVNARLGHLDHGDFQARIDRVYPGVPAAENLAAGQSDSASVVQIWLGSPGHRRNMLGPYDHAGTGSATAGTLMYYCAVFARLGD
jgi:uncharacterized protein YkwD